jgi:uncharacterized membrane protein
MTRTREVSSSQLEWLRREADSWRADGLLDGDAVEAILGRYAVVRGRSAVRLVSGLGAAFVGAGLISLVASNIDSISPLLRFLGIALVWLAAVGVAEMLRRREPTSDDEREGAGHRSPALGTARLVAVAAYGATIFQAAQSLQVPAFSSALVGCWAVGSLAYAYATSGTGPLLVGIATLVGWYAWVVGERADDAAAFVIGMLVGGVLGVATGAAQERGGLRRFASPWSQAGALLLLVALFAVALPDVARDGVTLPAVVLVGIALALAGTGIVAITLADAQARRELLASTLMLGAGLLLLAWAPEDVRASDGSDLLSGGELLHALVGTAVYLATAIWFAVVGAERERPGLTNLATLGLVLFVTVQSFGVFAPLLSGAALFLVVGAVLIGVGLAADRGRRRLVEEVTQ